MTLQAAVQIRKPPHFIQKLDFKNPRDARARHAWKIDKTKIQKFKNLRVRVMDFADFVHQLREITGVRDGFQLAAQGRISVHDKSFGNQMQVGTRLFIKNDFKPGKKLVNSGRILAFLPNAFDNTADLAELFGKKRHDQGR